MGVPPMGLVEQIKAQRGLLSGDEARRIRTEAGVSLRAVAHEVGVQHTTIRDWENGRSRPQGERGAAWNALMREISEVLAS